MTVSVKYIIGAISVLAIAAIGAAGYGYHEIRLLSERVADLDLALASTTVALEDDMSQTNAVLSADLEAQGKSVAQVEQQLGGFQDQVGTLEKLSQLDPQLLAKYSKVYFLNENYVPAQLAEIPDDYVYTSGQKAELIPQVLLKLESMFGAAKQESVNLYVVSAYRSYAEQKALKNSYTVTYGAGTANSFSADQGYSEHQLGTTVDVITNGLGGQLVLSFDQTKAYQWLMDNAYKYGFVLSYPKGNAYYIYEPWHWRYVGVKLATDLHNAGKHFYDLDQRTIDAYLVSIFD